MENNLNNKTLVSMHRHGECIEISTYSRRHGRHGRFYIVADSLAEYYHGTRRRSFFDTDCGNIAQISFYNGKCVMDFTWLSHYGSGKVEGITERVVIPATEMLDFMIFTNHDRQLISGEELEAGKVEFTETAMRNIRNLNRRQRRAFSKAMARGKLRWPNTATKVWADGKRDFYFSTDDGLCGGLILHTQPDGRCAYSVHT